MFSEIWTFKLSGCYFCATITLPTNNRDLNIIFQNCNLKMACGDIAIKGTTQV